MRCVLCWRRKEEEGRRKKKEKRVKGGSIYPLPDNIFSMYICKSYIFRKVLYIYLGKEEEEKE